MLVCCLVYANTPWKSMESNKNDTSVFSGYNSVCNSLQFRGTLVLVGFTFLYWASNIDDQKSIGSYVFDLGYGLVSRACKKQQVFLLSLLEVEYWATTNASQEALWI